MQGEQKPNIPHIPPDAKTAEHHAPPVDLNNPPVEPTPSSNNIPSGGGEHSESVFPTGIPSPSIPKSGYQSPEPIEAIFAQMREDQKKLETLILIGTFCSLMAISLCIVVLRARGALDVAG